MKRTGMLVLLAVLVLASGAQAASRPPMVAVIAPDMLIDWPAGGGVEVAVDPVEVAGVDSALHWSPSKGFHYGRNCCKRGGVGRSSRVSAGRFSGIDAASGRPAYVRARF